MAEFWKAVWLNVIKCGMRFFFFLKTRAVIQVRHQSAGPPPRPNSPQRSPRQPQQRWPPPPRAPWGRLYPPPPPPRGYPWQVRDLDIVQDVQCRSILQTDGEKNMAYINQINDHDSNIIIWIAYALRIYSCEWKFSYICIYIWKLFHFHFIMMGKGLFSFFG